MSERNNLNQNQPVLGQAGASARSAVHYQIPTEPGRNTSLILAGVMHGLLFLFLWVGVHWQSKTPVGVDAEIWDMNTRQAAPVPEPETTPPPPPPQPEQTEPPKPSQREIQEAHDAEIVLERAREKKLAEKQKLEEQVKQTAQLEKEQKEQKKLDQAKEVEKKKAEAKEQKQRADEIKRMTSQIVGTGTTGDAVKSTGNNRVDAGYAGRIAAKIKSNMVYVGSENSSDNPTVDFRIDLFPDGSLRGPPKKTKSSGVAAFDDAVERAITKSAPYPADSSGNVPTTIPLTYRLRD
jgi:colicin import membrane protein